MRETKTPPALPPAERLAEIRARTAELFSGAVIPDLVELAMAVAVSQRVSPHGPPVWMLFEGAPSSGKTAVVNLLKGLSAKPDPLVVLVPKITLGSLTGGFKDSKSRKRASPLLKDFHSRCWGNTEFSTLLTGKPEGVKEILGTLTSAFDGELRAAFGNVTEQDSAVLPLESRFSIVGCITPAARQAHTGLLSTLGPRFLSYRLLSLTEKERQRAFQLVKAPHRPARLKDLEALIAGHVRDVLKAQPPATIPEDVDRILQVLAQLVAAGRTPVVGGDGALMIEGGEDPIRVYQQLRALTVSLAVIHGTPTPEPRALRLVRDVALSSFEPRRAEALMVQRTSPVLAVEPGPPPLYTHGMTHSRLAVETDWSLSTACRVLAELCALGLYESAAPGIGRTDTSSRGPLPALWVPVPVLRVMLNTTFEEFPLRLLTIPELLTEPETFDGRLSPPDARLAASLAPGRAELASQLREAARRVSEAHPGEDPDRLAPLVIQEATGADSGAKRGDTK